MRTRILFSLVFVPFALATDGCGGSEPAKPADTSAPSPSGSPKAPLIPVKKAADWCGEHGVPESVCTKCKPELAEQFKAKGDWCKEHGVPESQCVACDPSLAAKFKAMAPK